MRVMTTVDLEHALSRLDRLTQEASMTLATGQVLKVIDNVKGGVKSSATEQKMTVTG